MSDPSHEQSYTLTSGPLRSAITIELHTHRAVQLWQGRQSSASPEGHPLHPIIGIPRFLNLLNIIRMDSSLDNPCADLYMLKLEERLLHARREMDRMTGSVNGIFNLLPDTLTVENCLSIQPVRFPVFSASQLGFIGIYLLTDFDKLARNIQLATHMALLNRVECNDLIQRSSGIIRSIFSLAQKYRRIPVNREDFKEDNARAKAATALVGKLPDDILDGSRRSQFAPPLRRTPSTENRTPSTENPPPPAPADETDDAAPGSPQFSEDTLPAPETEAE